jgi:glycosyltransferase involved in cell wall biosynthesis
MKFGLIVPRYGREVVGGTEHWLRALCERLVAMRGWEVEVFTTRARSAGTWADEYPPGTTDIEGVTVHRHASVSGRDPAYLAMYPKLRSDMESVSLEEAQRFVELVGPVCPDVLDHAERSDCELIAVTPYLYWPAVMGVQRLGARVLFHGAAHDETELHLPLMPAVFGSVGGFSYNSFAERALVERTFRVRHLPSRVIGNAVIEGSGGEGQARRELGLAADEPFVLCVGKVEHAKGSHVLARMWRLYRQVCPGAPRLVFIGPASSGGVDDDVLVVGEQPEAVKWGALRACTFLISPSAWESFSLVVVEAWLAGKPVLVNGRCGPTVEHCIRSAGGLWFDQFGDFAAACDLLLGDRRLRDQLARAGEVYARSTFAWPVVVERYEELASAVLARARA